MDHSELLKNSFREAIKFEEDGRKFFLKAAEESLNPFAKEVFQNLAAEELKHIKRIKEVYNNLKGEDWPSLTPSSDNLPWKNIFREALEKFKDIVKPGIQDADSLQLGLDFERKGYKFYDGLAKNAANNAEKKFFEILRDEEEGHYLIIENLQKYMENPVDWFGEQEHHIFEG
jgi:rubrerythrin